MTFFTHRKTLGLMPWERFVTTYSRDYKPPRERHPQVSRMRPRTEAAPALINSPQTDRETWPIFHQYFYKTTNSTYGSRGCSQSASCSLLPAFLPPFGTFAPSVSEASGVVGSTLTGARTQDARAARETGLLLGEEEENGQLHYVFGGKVDALEQQEAKDEPQQKIDVLYEEGVIVLSTHVGPACCEDFLQPACREAWLQHLLHLPVVSSSVITFKDAKSWDDSACLRSLKAATGLKNSTVLRPSSRQHSCCAWETECPNSCCYKMQTCPGVHCGSTLPLARVQPAVSCAEPSEEPWLTEYQSNYTTWAQPEIQRSDLHHHHPPHPQILYPSH